MSSMGLSSRLRSDGSGVFDGGARIVFLQIVCIAGEGGLFGWNALWKKMEECVLESVGDDGVVAVSVWSASCCACTNIGAMWDGL